MYHARIGKSQPVNKRVSIRMLQPDLIPELPEENINVPDFGFHIQYGIIDEASVLQ
jgi:hypothetical protein